MSTTIQERVDMSPFERQFDAGGNNDGSNNGDIIFGISLTYGGDRLGYEPFETDHLIGRTALEDCVVSLEYRWDVGETLTPLGI